MPPVQVTPDLRSVALGTPQLWAVKLEQQGSAGLLSTGSPAPGARAPRPQQG